MSPFWPEGQRITGQAKLDAPLSEDETGSAAAPILFHWQGHTHHIDKVSNRWRIHTNWWTQAEVWRDYWEVTTDTALLCVLYHDLISNAWYLERIYE